jgi:hypothetical protein
MVGGFVTFRKMRNITDMHVTRANMKVHVIPASAHQSDSWRHVMWRSNAAGELSDYCHARFIQLVPNQQSFGHMQVKRSSVAQPS